MLHLPMSRFDIADYLGTSPELGRRALAILASVTALCAALHPDQLSCSTLMVWQGSFGDVYRAEQS